jgi:protein TonB
MNFAQDKNGSSRFMGFGVVILIHIILIWAIASGLARKVVEKVAGPIETKVIEEQVKPPPPPEKVVPPPPDIKAPPPPFVPVPEVQIQAPSPPAVIQSVSTAPPPTREVAATPAPAPVAAPKSNKVSAASACPQQGSFEAPALNYDGGEASFQANVTVQNGRVVSVSVVPLRGGMDRKSQRIFVNALTQHIQDDYRCTGDNVVFQQEFVYKPQ